MWYSLTVSYAALSTDLRVGLLLVVAALVIRPILAVRVSRLDISAKLQRFKARRK